MVVVVQCSVFYSLFSTLPRTNDENFIAWCSVHERRWSMGPIPGTLAKSRKTKEDGSGDGSRLNRIYDIYIPTLDFGPRSTYRIICYFEQTCPKGTGGIILPGTNVSTNYEKGPDVGPVLTTTTRSKNGFHSC